MGAHLRHCADVTSVMLARNADVGGSVHAARELEDRFNHKHNYLESFLTSSRPRANSSGAPFPRSIPHESPEERVSHTQLMCHSSLPDLCILDRPPWSIGTNLRESTRQRRRTREIRCRKRISYAVAVYHAFAFPLYYIVFEYC